MKKLLIRLTIVLTLAAAIAIALYVKNCLCPNAPFAKNCYCSDHYVTEGYN